MAVDRYVLGCNLQDHLLFGFLVAKPQISIFCYILIILFILSLREKQSFTTESIHFEHYQDIHLGLLLIF